MYSYQRAVALGRLAFSEWLSVNIFNMKVADIFSKYLQVVLVVRHPTTGDQDLYVDMEQLRAEYALYQNTLDVLLQVLGDRDLDTIAQLPAAQKKVVKYRDIYQAGFSTQREEWAE